MKKNILFTVLALMIMVSCNNVLNHNGKQEENNAANGSVLSIKVNDNVSRTILPDFSMDIVRYLAMGNGPDGSTFNEVFYGSEKLIENLFVGPWAVNVYAFNDDDILIGWGSGSVTVLPNEPSSINITVRPLDGNGTLNLSLYWNSTDVMIPSIQSTLTPYSGSIRNLAFTVGDGGAQFSASDVEAGYHTLVLKLLDNGSLAMGAVEVVRIAADQVTNGTFTFDQINMVRGTINVDITPEMAEPLDITIYGGTGIKRIEDIMNLTALTFNYNENITYVWYVNGDSVGTGANFSFDSSWGNGSYRIDVTGFSADGKHGGSASLFVKVIIFNSSVFSPAAWFDYTITNNEVTITGLSGIWEALDDPVKNYLVIPKSIEGMAVTSIGSSAFFGCRNLALITIADSVTSIGDSVFTACISLKSITIPNMVISIGSNAFSLCLSLASITIPDSVTSIGDGAFAHCVSLLSVILNPIIPPTLGSNVFYVNPISRNIYVPPGSVAAYKAAPGWSNYSGSIAAQ